MRGADSGQVAWTDERPAPAEATVNLRAVDGGLGLYSCTSGACVPTDKEALLCGCQTRLGQEGRLGIGGGDCQ